MVQVKIVKQIKKDRMKSIVNLTNKKIKIKLSDKKRHKPERMDFCLLGFSKKLTGFAGLLERDTTPKTRVGNSIIGFFLDRIPRFCVRKIHSITFDLFKKIDESDSITKRVKDRRSKDRIPNRML